MEVSTSKSSLGSVKQCRRRDEEGGFAIFNPGSGVGLGAGDKESE